MTEFAEKMYIGEHTRDASSKVRGFMYQDLLAVEQLIESKESTFKLYSEWAEDIYTESDNNVTITQVKYYTSKSINFKEVYQELFYQYLRLKLLGCKKKITCKLSYYTKHKSRNCGSACHIIDNLTDKGINKIGNCEIDTLNEVDKQKILDSAYFVDGKLRPKDEREKYLYNNASNYNLLREFINRDYEEDFRNDEINDFREYLKKRIYDEVCNNIDVSHWKKELLCDVAISIAVCYIQESYNESNLKGKERRRTKSELMTKIINIVNGANGCNTIAHILQCYIDELLIDYILEDESLENNSQKNKIIKFYENLAASTKIFFNEFLITIEAEYSLLNTISNRKKSRLNKDMYNTECYLKRCEVFMEHRQAFESFCMYTWKILYDLDCSEFGKYIKKDFKEYLRFDFPNNKKVVILSQSNYPNREGRYIYERFKEVKERPQKWLWRNNKIRGFRNYELDVKNISEELENSTAYISEEMFEVECLECIKTEEDFANKENCYNCIFSDECIRKDSE